MGKSKNKHKKVKEQGLSVQETKEVITKHKEATQDSTQTTQDLTNLKHKLENASDEEKGEILKPYIQNQEYKAQSDKLLEIIQKKGLFTTRNSR